MLPEVLHYLSPVDGGVYVDGTFGAGGYSAGLLDAAGCRVVAIDRDPAAVARAQEFGARYGGRFVLIQGCFGDVADLLREAGTGLVDGFVLDLGVSSFQLDEAGRGFSFRFDGPLDMRMDTGAGQTAADLVNALPEKALADLIYQYGEERHSRKIAYKIVARRAEKKFETTLDLADVVRAAIPKKPGKPDIDPATRTFQALRIAVNDEMGELERALESAAAILKPGGCFVVVSFHSLEDGAVKRFFREKSGKSARGSRYFPEILSGEGPFFEMVTSRAIFPSERELKENPRSRSARLRCARRAACPVVGGAL